MRVLVTWGSKLGGTEGIARAIAETLSARGFDVTARDAAHAPAPGAFDAVIVGGALYANRWHRAARAYASHHARSLRHRLVWLFSSGPLDDSAARGELPPVGHVDVLARRIGAIGHTTFGGRLEPDAKGIVASTMAKTQAGDWRDLDRVRAWADEIADELPSAVPRPAIDPPARAWLRLVAHATAGWSGCAIAMTVLLSLVSPRAAFAIHAVIAPVVFGLVANHYFAPRGAREPLATALAFAAIVAGLDIVVVGGIVQHDLAIARSLAGFWLPLALIFGVTWAVGEIRSMIPVPRLPAGRVGTPATAAGHTRS